MGGSRSTDAGPMVTARPELVFAHDAVDVNGLVTVGKYDRPIAVSYSTEYNYLHYLDGEMQQLSVALAGAAGGDDPIVTILDESWDGQPDTCASRLRTAARRLLRIR